MAPYRLPQFKFKCFFFTSSCRKAVNINPKNDAELFGNVDGSCADSGLFLFALSCTVQVTSVSITR